MCGEGVGEGTACRQRPYRIRSSNIRIKGLVRSVKNLFLQCVCVSTE